METSLRLRGADSTSGQQLGLRIHAKQKLPIAYNALLQARKEAFFLSLFSLLNPPSLPTPQPNQSINQSINLRQAHAEIDTATRKPCLLAVLARHFFPQLSANVGAGVQLERGNIFRYAFRGKKAVSFTDDGLLGLNIKGRLLADKNFKPRRKSGAVELAWTILDFRKGQDVRIKAGYELYRKMPYFQLRENNWTLNGYMDGKWDVRFDM
ncbi:outer envelope pore protein 21, chloroplastic [Hordeum vulgare]|nr:outer envelope pore protein 21, chloroplastic [Hordeum vulgare]